MSGGARRADLELRGETSAHMMDRCLLALLTTTNAFAPPTSHVHTPSIRSSAAESLIEDDGFALARHRQNPSIQRRLFGRQPGTLILVRHGESTWNANSTFTGWADVDLSDRGEREVEHAARLRAAKEAPISAIFHSFRLIFGRAIISRNGLEAWMLFPERARAEHSR